MWNSRPLPPQQPVQPPVMQQGSQMMAPGPQVMPAQPAPTTNMGWTGQPPTTTDPYYGQLTPEQYKQWETYYQQYAAWYAQYGEQYAKMQGAPVAPPQTNPYATPAYPTMTPVTSTVMYPQPPLPQETQPAPPPPSEPPGGYVAAKAAPVTYPQQMGMPPQPQNPPYSNQFNNWNHQQQQRPQYSMNPSINPMGSQPPQSKKNFDFIMKNTYFFKFLIVQTINLLVLIT